jgi:GT2 family glycosyltransferase
MNRVNIIVPVYGDPKGLKICLGSLKKYYQNLDWVDVYFVNDCGPEAGKLEKIIKSRIDDVSNFYYHSNPENLGFVKNVNNATFNIVKDKKADILLVNSDSEVKTGAIEELRKLLNDHKDFAAVNPRTNNAVMFGGVSISVPLDSNLSGRPDKSYRLFKKRIKTTPEYEKIPVYSGFFVLIRRKVIDKIGLLDEVYEKGYFDDNDMSMRIRKLGYKCVVSNRAFAVHFGSTSFSDEYRIHRSNVNQKIFLKRYPDYFDFINKYPETLSSPQHKKTPVLVKAAELSTKALRYGNDYGYKKALKKSGKVIAKKVFKIKTTRRKPMVQVWFHEITNTGAPLVMLDVIREWKKDKSFPKDIGYFYPIYTDVNDEAVLHFMDEGVKPQAKSKFDTDFSKGDVAILNSALPDWVYEKVFSNLRNGVIKHAYLYIHENNQLFLVRHIDKLLQKNIDLLKNDKITMYHPSQETVAGWKKSLDIDKNIFVMSGRVKPDKRMFKERSESDFSKINFISSGSSVPRKGYLSIVYAIITFYNSFYKKNPSKYRDFSLNIWGFGKDDYFYNDFIENAAKGLKGKIKLIPKKQSLDDVYDFFAKNNFNITYSIDETYSMVTMENMSFGYPIIRSEVPGLKEQLKPGKNGWLVPTTDWWKLVETIEEVANKEKTSNEKLKYMSDESIKIAMKEYNRPYRLISDYKYDIKK